MIIKTIDAIASPLAPYTAYRYSIELHPDVADLWWTIDESKNEITFELHMKTTGWIALGISPGRSFLTFICAHRHLRSLRYIQLVV